MERLKRNGYIATAVEYRARVSHVSCTVLWTCVRVCSVIVYDCTAESCMFQVPSISSVQADGFPGKRSQTIP